MNTTNEPAGIDLDNAALDNLEALARAATPGPWKVRIDGTCSGAWPHIDTEVLDEYGDPITVAELSCSHVETDEARESKEMPGPYSEKPHRFEQKEDEPALDDANFIAAANPATVLALIALARRAPAPVAVALDKDAEKQRFITWGQVFHRNARSYTARDFGHGLAAWLAAKADAVAQQSPAPVVSHDAPEARAYQPEGATGTTGATVIWPSEKFVHERIATLMADIGMPDDTPLWNALSRFEDDLRSRVEAMPAFPAAATSSIDTLEFQALAGTWCGASQSCDRWTRTIGAKQAWADLIGHIEARLAAPASAQPDRGAAQDEPVQVKVERSRVWIVKGNRSFMLAYVPDEGDDPAEMEAYANNLRSALSIFTPDVKSGVAAPSPASQPVAPDLAALIHYPECWDTAAYPTLGDALHECVAALKCSECAVAPSDAKGKADAACESGLQKVVDEYALARWVQGGNWPEKWKNILAAIAITNAADTKDAARYRVLRQNVKPADVSITMTRVPPAGQSSAERIDMLCDLFIERNRAAMAAAPSSEIGGAK